MAEKMLAAMKTKPEAGAELCEVDIPVPKDDQVLIKINAAAICGTDKHIYEFDAWAASRIKPPMIFGHECSAEIIELGPAVKSLKVGDHVSVETHIPCRHCFQCKTGNMHLCKNLTILGVDIDGIFAEYAVVPEIVCWKNDKSMPIEIAAVQEPLGNSVYTVMETNVSAKRIAIIGDGPTAAFACGIAKLTGAAHIYNIGMLHFNLDICRQMGADDSINVTEEKDFIERIIDETSGGVDAVLDMAGNQKAVETGFEILRRTGTYTAFGISPTPFEFDFAKNIIFKGARIIGINGRKMFETWYQIKNFLDYNKLDITPVITHKFPFEDFEKAMTTAISPKIDAMKVILTPMRKK